MKSLWRIAGVTTSRADYGHLYWPFKRLQESGFDLKIVASGAHLSHTHGFSYNQIIEDGFVVDEQLDIDLSGASPLDTVMELSRATARFGRYFERVHPDLVLLLGDRYEVLGAAQAAFLLSIPVCHLAGGDVTEGAFDESLRHAITKLSHLHMPTNELSAKRIRQLGENPANIHNIGSPGLDFARLAPALSRQELEDRLGVKLRSKNLLVTFHPETLETDTVLHFEQLLLALGGLPADTLLIFTRPNADPGAQAIADRIEQFAQEHENAVGFSNLGSVNYLNLMKLSDAVVGNSSSGIYEAPSMNTATVNIGDRQKGRVQAVSVMNCAAVAPEIVRALQSAIEFDCAAVVNPYGDGRASERLVSILESLTNPAALLRKAFFEMS